MAEQNQPRQVALKLRVADLLSGQYVREEGWNPNYILTKDGRKASRVNVLGAVISVPTTDMNYRSLTIDDGTGSISVRSFDENDVFTGVGLGDAVFVIGRPRQYGSQTYLMPEIIKKVKNLAWVEVRKLEVGKLDKPLEEEPVPLKEEAATEEEIDVREQARGQASPQQVVYNLIKELDKGEGAEFEQVLAKANCASAEKVISQLLMEGEIFELGKGRLKVLE